MGFISLGRLNIQKRNSCARALVTISDVQHPSVYNSHILNVPINKLNISCFPGIYDKISFFSGRQGKICFSPHNTQIDFLLIIHLFIFH